MPENIQKHHGYFVSGGGDLLRASRGYALTTQRGTIPRHNGVIVKSSPNALFHAFAVIVKNRPGSLVLRANGIAIMQTFFPPWEALTLDVEFLDRQFPEKIGYGSRGGPGFKTSVFRMDSGFETTQPEWDRIRARYTVEYPYATALDVAAVEDFFYGMRGRAIGFRFKDWTDYQITNQIIGVGDGAQTRFQLFKRYESGGHHFDRIIKKPVKGTVQRILVDDAELLENTDFSISYGTGVIVFNDPPAAGTILTITYIEYDVPVRFDTDEMIVAAIQHDQFSITGLDMIEVIV